MPPKSSLFVPTLLALALSPALALAQDASQENVKLQADEPAGTVEGAVTQKDSLAKSHRFAVVPLPPPPVVEAEPLKPSSPWSGGGELG